METNIKQTMAVVSDVVVESTIVMLSRWMASSKQGGVHNEQHCDLTPPDPFANSKKES